MTGRGPRQPGVSLLSFDLALCFVSSMTCRGVVSPQRASSLPRSASSRLGPLSDALAGAVAHVFHVDVLVVTHDVLIRVRTAGRLEHRNRDPRLVFSFQNCGNCTLRLVLERSESIHVHVGMLMEASVERLTGSYGPSAPVVSSSCKREGQQARYITNQTTSTRLSLGRTRGTLCRWRGSASPWLEPY